MIAIIAEKPSVGQEIARVVGATEKKDGYITGNGYMVTWALGHLVSLALPGTYGYTRTTAEDLPMLPEPFRLVERQIRTDRGMVTDIAAGRQLKVIDGVFSECDSIIVATDAGREGELIFRWIYSHLGCTKPFKRLWFSSLTDEAIRKGMADLREGYEYDSLYAAADSRAKADWLVGMNASRALAAVSGSANNSIGRVQTPTLAMICARFKENRNSLRCGHLSNRRTDRFNTRPHHNRNTHSSLPYNRKTMAVRKSRTGRNRNSRLKTTGCNTPQTKKSITIPRITRNIPIFPNPC